MTENISVGAVGAAIIGGLISLISLVISKEQKISDFRQEWINKLREEFVSYITHINSIIDCSNIDFKNNTDRVERMSPLYNKLNQANFSIILRLNEKEAESKAVTTAMAKFYALFSMDLPIAPESVRPIEEEFLNSSKALLKNEWVRVKRGETTFRITKALLFAMVLVSISLMTAFYADTL